MPTFCDRCGAPAGAGDQRCRTCGWPVPVPLTPAELGERGPRGEVSTAGVGPVRQHDDDPVSTPSRGGREVEHPAASGRWRLQEDPELAQWREEPAPEEAPVHGTFGAVTDDGPSGALIALRVLAALTAAVGVVLLGLVVLHVGVLRSPSPSTSGSAVRKPTTRAVTPTPRAATSTAPRPSPAATPKPPSPTTPAFPAVTIAGKPCGGNGAGPWSQVAAGTSQTSCPFALSVQQAYLASAPQAGQPRTVSATSPITGKAYPMTCTGNQPVSCSGGNGAVVYLYGGQATFR